MVTSDIVASRDLEFRFSGGAAESVEVSFCKPSFNPDVGYWECQYSVVGESIDFKRNAAGADSVQALSIALKSVATDLRQIELSQDGSFYLEGEPGHEFHKP